MTIRIVFMGSPDFALPSLAALHEQYEIVGVITQPDRPSGRGKMLMPPPVKTAAMALGLPVIQPEKLKEPAAQEALTAWQPDVIVVAAFGQILRKSVLELPPYGCINVHASLLPRWRGASPIHAAILAGDTHSGVTIMKMDAGIDTGDMLDQRQIGIDATDTTITLSEKLSHLGASLLSEVLPKYIRGEIFGIPQGEDGVTYAGMIHKEEAVLDFSKSAEALVRVVRAYLPWPVAKVVTPQGELLIYKAHAQSNLQVEPGKQYVYQKKPCFGTDNGLLVLDEIQPAGKKVMDSKAYLNGIRNWGTIIT